MLWRAVARVRFDQVKICWAKDQRRRGNVDSSPLSKGFLKTGAGGGCGLALREGYITKHRSKHISKDFTLNN